MTALDGSSAERIDVLRRFSRLYTGRVGLAHAGLLNGPLSPAEARIMCSLSAHDLTTVGAIVVELGLDTECVNGILHSFEERGIVTRRRCGTDLRRSSVLLTGKGRRTAAMMDALSRHAIQTSLMRLSEAEQAQLAQALDTAAHLLAEPSRLTAEQCSVRQPQPDELGWIVERLAGEDDGGAAASDLAARYQAPVDAAGQGAWVVEAAGRRLGAVVVVRENEVTARLCLLYVEPECRGLGVGRILVAAAINFAVAAGYRTLMLSAPERLAAARRLFAVAGFREVAAPRGGGGTEWRLVLGPTVLPAGGAPGASVAAAA